MKNAYFNTDKIFYVVNYILLTLFLIVVLVPIMFIVSASFSSASAVSSGEVLIWPVEPTLVGYQGVFKNDNVMNGFRNSFFYLAIEVIVGLALTILASFALSVKDLPGGRVISFLFTFTMLFGGGLIPTYLLINSLGMLNTVWAVTIPGAIAVYHMILMKSYFRANIPEELFESASMDGCSVFRYLIQFVIPLSGAIIAIIGLYIAVGSWNSWYNAMVYLNDPNKFPLQLVLRDILIESVVDYSMLSADEALLVQQQAELLKYSVIVVSTLPMMIIYPFVQKYFVKGLMAGAVKG